MKSLVTLSKAGCTGLIIYFFWYVEKYGNNKLFVYGSFLIASIPIIIDVLNNRELDISIIPIGVWNNFIMVVYCFITGLFVAINQNALVSSLITYLIYSIVSFAICYVSIKEKSITWLLLAIITSTLICCASMCFDGYHYDANRIVLSANSNPNVLGIILTIGVFCVAYLFNQSISRITIGTVLILVLFYYVIQTGSRKSFIASCLIIFCWFLGAVKQLLYSKKQAYQVYLVVFVVGVIILSFIYYRNFYTVSALHSRFQTISNEESNSNRIQYYLQAVNLLEEHPLFGVGFSQFGYTISGRPGHSHSTYAEAIACFGTVGSIIYFIPIIITCIKTFCLSVFEKNNSKSKLIFAFVLMEMFLGTVTIFFYEMFHFIAWSIILISVNNNYLNVDPKYKNEKLLDNIKMGKTKYVKD